MAKRVTRKVKRPVFQEGNVLIVKPHNIERQTDERVNNWIMQAFQRGVGEYLPIPAKLPELARNWAISEFLTNPKNKDKTHIFFIDSDTEPMNPYAIEKLLSHNKPVVAGVTPIVRVAEDIRCMWSVVTGDGDDYDPISIEGLPTKLFQAKRVGGTTLLVRRDVLEKLEKPYQISTWKDDMTGQTFSEDFYFSDKIREAGFNIYVDPTVICHHYHNFDLLDVFSIWEASVKAGRFDLKEDEKENAPDAVKLVS